ncbi:hypothetical protein ACX35W_002463, partial [Enterococcus faecium]
MIEVGQIYYYKIPEVSGSFKVKVIEKQKYKGFLVDVVSCTVDQRKILRTKGMRMVARGDLLTKKSPKKQDPKRSIVIQKKRPPKKVIEIGKIY